MSLSSIGFEPCFSLVSSQLHTDAVLMAGSVDLKETVGEHKGLPKLGSRWKVQVVGTGVFATLLSFRPVQSNGCTEGCCEHQPCGSWKGRHRRAVFFVLRDRSALSTFLCRLSHSVKHTVRVHGCTQEELAGRRSGSDWQPFPLPDFCLGSSRVIDSLKSGLPSYESL